MKTHLKFAFGIILLFIGFTSCGTTHQCMEEDKDDSHTETSFKEDIPAEDDFNKKWVPAAERGTVSVDETTNLASDNVSEEIDEDVEEERTGIATNAGKKKKSKFRNKKRNKGKEIVDAIKEHRNNKNKRGVDGMLILLIILAIILPPLAVGIFEGITGRFWLVLILALIGIGLFGFLPGIFYLGGLAWLIAVILALLIVLEVW